MTLWQAFLLGLIQGITEFLPISSSGHLALGQYFLGFENLQDFILFDLICHLGTLFAICYVFFPIIRDSFSTGPIRSWQIVVGTLPLFPLVFILKPLKSLFDQPALWGPCFLITAGLLFASLTYRFPEKFLSKKYQWGDSLTIGIFQAIAILPGVSRSGATISAARLLGWQKEQAVQFSFLLAIPAILGGSILEGWKAWHLPSSSLVEINPWSFIIGFITSFIIGSLTLQLLVRLVIENKWKYFAWYCLILGMITTIYFNVFIHYDK